MGIIRSRDLQSAEGLIDYRCSGAFHSACTHLNTLHRPELLAWRKFQQRCSVESCNTLILRLSFSIVLRSKTDLHSDCFSIRSRWNNWNNKNGCLVLHSWQLILLNLLDQTAWWAWTKNKWSIVSFSRRNKESRHSIIHNLILSGNNGLNLYWAFLYPSRTQGALLCCVIHPLMAEAAMQGVNLLFRSN